MRTPVFIRPRSSSAAPLFIAIIAVVAITFVCQAYSGSREGGCNAQVEVQR